MPNPSQITGRVTVKVDSEILLTKTGWKFRPGGVSRTPVKGDVVHGYTEAAEEARVSGSISHTEAVDLIALGDVDDATVMFETDTGQAYVLPHAWQEEAIELTAGEGEVPLAFAAKESRRVE